MYRLHLTCIAPLSAAHRSRRERFPAVCRAESQPEHSTVETLNAEKALVGEDFGARDAFAGELETGFGAKALGFADTLHVVKPPSGIEQFIGLAATPITEETTKDVLSEETCWTRRSRIPGWRVLEGDNLRLTQSFKLKDGEAGEVAKARFVELADMAGHSMYRADVEGDELVVELRTEAMGGVTQSDFILAARLNQIDLSDLKAAKKRQFWA